jgi:hypothetical protein
MKPKLAKDSKNIKLRHISGRAESTINRALLRAKEKGWTKVIVIGQSKDHRGVFHSTMGLETIMGMMEIAKSMIMEDC